MSKKGNLAKNTLILSIGSFLPKCAGFITLPILTGFMTKEEYGTYDLITILVSLYLPELTLQIKTAAFRFLLDIRDDFEKQRKVVTNIFALTLPISVVALILLYFILPGSSPVTKLFVCGYYFADILVNTIRQVSRGIGKNMPYSISAVISALGKMIFALILVKILRWGLMGAVIALCAASTFSLIYVSLRINIFKFIDRKLLDKELLKEMIGYSWPMVPNDMSMWVMNVSDRFIVTKVMGLASNAVYAASTKIPSLINLAQTTLNLAWTENASIAAKDKDSEAYYTEMLKTMMNLQAGVYGVVMGAMPLLFKILINSKYAESYAQMPILCYAIYFQGLAMYLGGIYVAKKATKNVGITSIVSAVINIVVNFALIHHFGIFAASISTFVSYMTLFIYRFFNVQRLTKIKMNIPLLIVQNGVMIVEFILAYQNGMIFYVINAVIGVVFCIILNKEIVAAIFNKMLKLVKGHSAQN